MRRFWLLVGMASMVVMFGFNSAQAATLGLRQVSTGATSVVASLGDTVDLELYLDTEGLSFEGYYVGVDFSGGPLTITSVIHQPLPGLFPDIFGATVIDNVASTIRDINQTTFATPLGAGTYVLDLISVEVGALVVGQTITATPGLFDSQVLGLGGGSCPGTYVGCSVSVQSFEFTPIPEPGTALLTASGLLILAARRPKPGARS